MAEGGKGFSRVRELLQKLKPHLGEQAERIFQAFLYEDADGKSEIENYLEALYGSRVQTSLSQSYEPLIPPEPETAAGEYPLGTVRYGDLRIGPFGLREDEWIQHVGIFGRSGAGKTNTGFLVMRELRAKRKPFLALDWKRNYRDLAALPGMEDIEVYTVGRPVAPFAFNPLVPPPGIPPKTWLKKIIEVVAHAYLLGDGVLHLLQITLDAVYVKFGIYEGNPSRYPVFRDVLNEVRDYPAKGREAGWLSSMLRALSALCFGDMEGVMSTQDNNHIDALLERSAILELDALTQADKIFFVESLLLWIHHRRMVEGARETFKHAIIIEEAHHVLSGERRSLIGGQSVMEITFREIREFGESLILLDQHPSQISLPALGNTYTTICLNLKHGKDVGAMGQAMLMDGGQKDILGALEVGQAVVKLQGRITRPFLIEIPLVPVKKGRFTDQDVARRPRSYIQTELIREIANARPAETEPEPDAPTDNGARAVQELVLRMLEDIFALPESGIARRYERLGISVRQGQKLKQKLLDERLATESLETTEKGVSRRMFLTEAGRSALKSKN